MAVGCEDETQDCDCAEIGCFADMCTKTVFVSAEPISAAFGGVAAADQLCAQQAAAAMLPGTYYAWLSDGTQSPFGRFSKSTVPYVLPDGTQVAADYAALRSDPVGPRTGWSRVRARDICTVFSSSEADRKIL